MNNSLFLCVELWVKIPCLVVRIDRLIRREGMIGVCSVAVPDEWQLLDSEKCSTGDGRSLWVHGSPCELSNWLLSGTK